MVCMVRIIDIYGNFYHVPDIQSFKEHIFKYHTIDGKPDNSIHEENGFYFRVNYKFLNSINSLY